MLKVSILGVTGYVGAELIKLLSKHPYITIEKLISSSSSGKGLQDIYRNFNKNFHFELTAESFYEVVETSDLIFSALPHGLIVDYLKYHHLEKVKIIDLSADFRIPNETINKTWYGFERNDTDLITSAVYGLTEVNRPQISQANFVANPGCFTTCSILSLFPFLKGNFIDKNTIIIDAKSGVSGAGRSQSLDIQFCEVNESIKAYKVGNHRHTPEIEEQLKLLVGLNDLNLTFTPHLVPMNRGILTTIYANLLTEVNEDLLRDYLIELYKDEYFIRVLPKDIYPETRWVKGSNYFDIAIKVDTRTNRLIIVSALDNLMKGAASQAIQNMNLIYGWNESTGIDFIPSFPI
jgi:N-acetyl-gamma-glutamyl-phosphate reductase